MQTQKSGTALWQSRAEYGRVGKKAPMSRPIPLWAKASLSIAPVEISRKKKKQIASSLLIGNRILLSAQFPLAALVSNLRSFVLISSHIFTFIFWSSFIEIEV